MLQKPIWLTAFNKKTFHLWAADVDRSPSADTPTTLCGVMAYTGISKGFSTVEGYGYCSRCKDIEKSLEAASTSEAEAVNNFGTLGDCILLRSGRYLNLKDPQPDQFIFSDLAHGLAMTCRFAGQCLRFYSVAEHLCHAYEDAGRTGLQGDEFVSAAKALLLHDAEEAFIHDVSRPLKRLLPEYKALQKRMSDVILEKYGVSVSAHSELVKRVDRSLLIWERNELFPKLPSDKWEGEDTVDPPCSTWEIRDWFPAAGFGAFMLCGRVLGLPVDEK